MKKFYFLLISLISIQSTKAAYTLENDHPDYHPDNAPTSWWSSYDAIGIVYTIGEIITLGIQLSGSVAVFFIVQAGFKYVTALGQQEKIDGAKKQLTWAILGLLAIIMSYAIVENLLNVIMEAPREAE